MGFDTVPLEEATLYLFILILFHHKHRILLKLFKEET